MRKTTGRCYGCKVRFVWNGKPLLKNALCPRCGEPLHLTTHIWSGENSYTELPRVKAEARGAGGPELPPKGIEPTAK